MILYKKRKIVKNISFKLFCIMVCVKLEATLIVSGSLGGGLGNQMFVAAATYAYAMDIGAEAIFPRAEVAHVGCSPVLSRLTRFNGDQPQLPVIWERGLKWIDLPKENPQSVCIAGFFQSAKYFHHRRSEILDLFGPAPEIVEYLEKKYAHFLHRNTVSIHVRRGDYLRWLQGGMPVMYNLSEDEYYEKALSNFDCENDFFVFFSDDMEFVKTMSILRRIKCCFLVENQEHWEDLYLMSLCKNHIIANSTFSWWGAYLCQNSAQKVIFPWRWFGAGLPSGYSSEGKERHYFKAPLYTPMSHWITIE